MQRVKFLMDIQTRYGFKHEGQEFDCPSAGQVALWEKNKQVTVLTGKADPVDQPFQHFNLSNMDSLGQVPTDQPMPSAFQHVPAQREVSTSPARDSGKSSQADVKPPKTEPKKK